MPVTVGAAEYGVEGAWALQVPHRIRWAECDQYGHVNHAAYLTLCEDLRVAHWLRLGGRFAPEEPGPVVAQLEARYLRPLGFDDAVLLTLRPVTVRRTSYVHEYAVWRGGLCFSGRAVLVVVRNSTGERVPVPPEMRRTLLAEGAREEG